MKPANYLEMFLTLNANAFKQGIKAAGESVRGIGPAVSGAVGRANGMWRSGVGAVRSYRDEIRRLNNETSELKATVGQLGGLIGGGLIAGAVGSSAVSYNSTVEQSQIGLAALVRTFNEFPAGVGAYESSMQIATDIQRQLQIEGLKTVATYEQLLVALQEGVGPAFRHGFNPRQVVQFTSLMTQAAAAISLPMDQLGQEIRSILDGTIDRNSRVAKALEITNEKVKEMAASGQLFEYLKGRLVEFSRAGEDSARTWTGAFSNLIDAVQMGLGKGLERSFTAGKKLFLDLRDVIVDIDEVAGTFTFNEKIVAAIDKADAAITGFVASLTREDLERYLVLLAETGAGVVEVFALFFKTMKSLADTMGPALPTIAKWTTAFILFGGVAKLLLGVPLAIAKQLIALNAAFVTLSGGSVLLYIKHIQQASQHTGIFRTAIASLPNALVTAGGVMAAALIGWQIGTWLYNQSDIVKQAGNRIAATFTKMGLKAKQAWAWVTGGDTEAVHKEIDEADRIYKELYDGIGQGAKQAAESQKVIAREAKKSAEMQAKSQKAATDEMKKAYTSFGEKVRQINDDIAGRQRSLADQLREMGRTGMSDLSAWKDRKKEAAEFAAAARKAAEAATAAFAAGDDETGYKKYEEAVELYDKARNAAAELNKEIREGDTVIQSQQESLNVAKGLVEKYGQAGIDTQKEFEQAVKDAAEALNEQSGGTLAKELPEVARQFGEVNVQAEDLAGKSRKFNEAWNDAWGDFLKDGNTSIGELDARLSQLTKDRNIKVYVTEVTKRMLGGAIGAVQALAAGGQVAFRNMLAGGFFPGFGGGDRRHVVAEDGEYMLNKFATREMGLTAATYANTRNWPALVGELINRFNLDVGSLVRRATGGMISAIPVLPPMPQMLATGGSVVGGGSGGNIIRHEHNLRTADGRRATVYTDDFNADRFISMLERALVMSS